LRLPAFLPDATRGVVRSLDATDLVACGVEGLVVNALHLSVRPGAGVISALGGIHQFINWRGPVLSDSGGFQVFSLLAEPRRPASVTGKGFHYRLRRGGRKKVLTPEKCIRKQVQMGADIVVCLDHCTHPDAPPQEQRASVENTVRWARACRQEFDRLCGRAAGRPLLFAVIQGGNDPGLRRECAERLFEIGFDGYGYGGWPIGSDGQLVESVVLVAELIPAGCPKWALGIGAPRHVVECARLGYGLFDCTLPTRDARHGRLYVFQEPPGRAPLGDKRAYGRLYPRDRKHARAGQPVDGTCDCLCCANYSLGYLHHLFRVGDSLAHRLATIHNLRFYARLMDCLRGTDAG
jgi:queuine tRNA-ribosyltransferase